jgi:lipopolysaccharide export system permease protein
VYDRKNARYSNPFQRVNFKEQVQKFDLSDFALSRTNEELFKSNYQMLNIRQLNVAIDSLQEGLYKKRTALSDNFLRNYKFLSNIDSTASQKADTIPELKADILSGYSNEDKSKLLELSLAASRNLKKMMEYHVGDYQTNNSTIIKHKVVWHKKFTLSFACMVLFFIGAPLGAIIRRGGLGLPVVVSVVFFILYHIISMIGEKSAKGDVMNIAAGMWLSSAIILPLGIYLTYKATVDAPIMDREIWNKLFDKVDLIKKLIKKYRK